MSKRSSAQPPNDLPLPTVTGDIPVPKDPEATVGTPTYEEFSKTSDPGGWREDEELYEKMKEYYPKRTEAEEAELIALSEPDESQGDLFDNIDEDEEEEE